MNFRFLNIFLVLFLFSFIFVNITYSLGRTVTPGYCDETAYDYFPSHSLCCIKMAESDAIDLDSSVQVSQFCKPASSTPKVCPYGYTYNSNDKLCYSHSPTTTTPNPCSSDRQLVGGNKCCAFSEIGGVDYNDCIPTSSNCPSGFKFDNKTNKCVENFVNLGSPTGQNLPTINLKPETCLGGTGLETALGCIPFEPVPFIGWILRWGIGIGGGIAFLLMAFASFQLMTSAGDPEKLKSGREMFVSAGAGLLFIIMSVFLLNLIGAEILQIPGF